MYEPKEAIPGRGRSEEKKRSRSAGDLRRVARYGRYTDLLVGKRSSCGPASAIPRGRDLSRRDPRPIISSLDSNQQPSGCGFQLTQGRRRTITGDGSLSTLALPNGSVPRAVDRSRTGLLRDLPHLSRGNGDRSYGHLAWQPKPRPIVPEQPERACGLA